MTHDTPQTLPKALVIDDEIQIRRLLRACLERNGYEVIEAATGDQGLSEAIRSLPEIVILDLGLPDMDGLAVLQRLREWTNIPIVILSVRGHEEDKISALDYGANDYVTKPFSTGEMLARLRVARRISQPSPKFQEFHSGRLKVDLTTRTVTVNDKQMHLTATEYALLRLFVVHAGKVLTHGHILREIWHTEQSEKTGYLRVYVAYLREKIEEKPSEPELLVTEPGVGYRLVLAPDTK